MARDFILGQTFKTFQNITQEAVSTKFFSDKVDGFM